MIGRLVALSCLVAVSSALLAAPVPMTKSYAYAGKNYSVKVLPCGALRNCMMGSVKVFTKNDLFGDYIQSDGKYDSRMFQYNATDIKATIEDFGDHRSRIVTTGMLGNEKKTNAASFRQITLLEPDGMTVDYEVRGTIPMKSNVHVFSNIMDQPLGSVVDRGILIQRGNKEELISIPLEVTRGKGYVKSRLQLVKISYPDGVFQITPAKDNCLSAIDCRSWGEQKFRFDAFFLVPWHETPIEYEAGKVWKWSLEYRFIEHR